MNKHTILLRAVLLLLPLAGAQAAEPSLKPLMLVLDQVVYQDDFSTNKALDTIALKTIRPKTPGQLAKEKSKTEGK